VEIVDVVTQEESGNQPDAAAAQRWVDEFGLTWVTVADVDGDWLADWGNANDPDTFTQHSYTIIGSDGRVAWRRDGNDGSTDEDIIEALSTIE
jgi:hypothetical protein